MFAFHFSVRLDSLSVPLALFVPSSLVLSLSLSLSRTRRGVSSKDIPRKIYRFIASRRERKREKELPSDEANRDNPLARISRSGIPKAQITLAFIN